MIDLPELGEGLLWDTSLLLTEGRLLVKSEFLVGDLNHDGFVGSADLDIVRGNSGTKRHLR